MQPSASSPTGLVREPTDLTPSLTDRDEVQDKLETGAGRYAAYTMRLKTVIAASSRYIA